MFAKAWSDIAGEKKRKRKESQNDGDSKKQQQQQKFTVEKADERSDKVLTTKPRSLLTQALYSLGERGRGSVSNPNSFSNSSSSSGGGGGNKTSKPMAGLFDKAVADIGARKENPNNDTDKDTEKKPPIIKLLNPVAAAVKKVKLLHKSEVVRRSVVVSGFVNGLCEEDKLNLLQSLLQGCKKNHSVHWLTANDCMIVYENEMDSVRGLRAESNILLRKSLLQHFEHNSYKHVNISSSGLSKLEEEAKSNMKAPDLKDTVSNRIIKNSLGLKVSLVPNDK